MSEGNCTECEIGEYKETIGNTNCTTCGIGFTTTNTGSTNSSDCCMYITYAKQYNKDLCDQAYTAPP